MDTYKNDSTSSPALVVGFDTTGKRPYSKDNNVMGHCSKGCGAVCKDLFEPVSKGVGSDNPILSHMLGICSALAVTGNMKSTLVMCLALTVVATGSTFLVSILSKFTPHRVRMIMQMLVIATLVTVVNMALLSFESTYETAEKIGTYIALIITNCLIMGRCEAYSMRHGPIKSALDGFGSSLGYSIILVLIAFVREVFGAGKLMGERVWDIEFGVLSSFAGAFLAMAVVVWVVRSIWPDETANEHPEATQ